MPKILTLTRLGNPILREKMPKLSAKDIVSVETRELIENIRYTNQQKKYGMGLAAPQVGARMSLSVIGIKPTPTRPDLEVFESVIINPEYVGVGRRARMWEGCQSIGTGDDILYGKVLRYKQIRAKWLDETGAERSETLDGFVAHVFQHETDHLDGVVFMDRDVDRKSLMMADEFRERVVKKANGIMGA